MSSRSETVKAIVADFRREMRRIHGAAPSEYVTKRVEKAAHKITSPSSTRKPAELLKAAMAGDPDAQRAWRQAVMASGQALQTEQAIRTAQATMTGKRASMTKAGTARALGAPTYGPHAAAMPVVPLPPAVVGEALASMANMPANAVLPAEVAQRLRAAGIPLPSDRASDLFAWLAPRERIDPVTTLPVDERMRPITGDYTGKATPAV